MKCGDWQTETKTRIFFFFGKYLKNLFFLFEIKLPEGHDTKQ